MNKLFRVCKGKKLLKAGKVKFLCFNFINKPIRFRINHKAWLAIFFVAVIIPCLIKANTFLEVQEVTKLNNSDFVSIVSISKGFVDTGSVHSIRRISIIKISEFLNKVSTEIGSGLVELFSTASAFAEDVGDRGATTRSDNGATSPSDDTERIHKVLSLLLGWFLGTVSFVVGFCIYTMRYY